MSVRSSEDFKIEVVKAYMAEDRSHAEIVTDYHIAKSTVSTWIKQYGEKCQYTHTTIKTFEERIPHRKSENYIKK